MRKSQVAVAIALRSVNTKEASNANCVNEPCKILRCLNRVFVFEIVLCIGAPSKDPAWFVDLGFWILRNKEAQEYKSSSQETNHNTREVWSTVKRYGGQVVLSQNVTAYPGPSRTCTPFALTMIVHISPIFGHFPYFLPHVHYVQPPMSRKKSLPCLSWRA